MKILERIKPPFWDKRPSEAGSARYRFNYRRIWKVTVLVTSLVSLIPLIFITIVNYNATEHAFEAELSLRTARLVSNTRRAISFFLTERRSALEFIVRDNSYEDLNNAKRLQQILDNLKESFGGGFVDLGVINSAGIQKTCVGPYCLTGKDYSKQPWFKQVVDHNVYISDVFLGYRKVPHLVIAVKKTLPDGSYHILRASLGINPFEDLLAHLELEGNGDAFIINHKGILQTVSRHHGGILEELQLPIPSYAQHSEVIEIAPSGGQRLLVGYRFIEDTPVHLDDCL